VGLALLVLASRVGAQELDLHVARGPHYAGVPIEIELRALGFEEDPQPEARAPAPARGGLELLDVAPNVSSSITIVDGRISQTKTVEFVYRFRLLVSQPGPLEVGPFQVSQGSVVRTAPALSLEVRGVPESDRMRVELRLPSSPLYVGARVPVALQFWLEKEFRSRVHAYRLHAPLFDLSDVLRFLDASEVAGGTPVSVETASGTLKLQGRVREEISQGRRYTVVSVERTVVPLQAGSHPIPPASLLVDEATRWKRDLFGRRRATHVAKWRTRDRPRTLEVRPLPAAGRPDSFAGAVGRGFALEVTAERSVVQVGEPITLTFTLRGEGNLETVGFPPLDAEGLLPPASFRVPDTELTGDFDGTQKRFTAVVRVLDERVEEIPALTYAWFNPETQSYETTHSRPIALAVRHARMVGAGDVIHAEAGETAQQPSAARRPEAPQAKNDRFLSTDADLAIESDVTRLLHHSGGGWGEAWLSGGLYAGSGLVLLAALWDRRRRSVDPARLQRRKALEAELRRIREASRRPALEATAELADALRRMLAKVPEARSGEIERVLAECDAWNYAPAALRGTATLDASVHERAVAIAERLVERAG
jgi:hypothetical protein